MKIVDLKVYIGGVHLVVRMDNGFGASIVRNDISHGKEDGKYELGVIKFEGDNWKLHYDNPVANGDVIGWLSMDDINALLVKIGELQ
jgi:hypothetical protein